MENRQLDLSSNDSVCEQVSLGVILRERREQKGLDLKTVSQELRINIKYLEFFESNPQSLKNDIYTVGFLRAYIYYLGLDAEPLLKMFKDMSLPCTDKDDLALAAPSPVPRRGIPKVSFVVCSAVVLCCAALYWGMISKKDDLIHLQMLNDAVIQDTQDVNLGQSQEDFPSRVTKTEEMKSENISTEKKTPETISSDAFVSPQNFILLKAVEKTWLEIKKINGEIIISQVFYPGQEFKIENPQETFLKIGNAGGIQLFYEGKMLSSLGKHGEVLKEVSLNPEKLLADPRQNH